jgi:predicted lipoprotein with Yx(FWY)xxD motif
MNRKVSTYKSFNLMAFLAVVALVLAACAPAATPTAAVPNPPAALPAEATSTAAPPTAAPAMATEATIAVGNDPVLGNILVDGKGMTLYIFTKDTPGASNCNAGCLKLWPPLLTNGSPVAGSGVDASLLGSAALADGRMIVTYNKMPLYYWAKDQKPGDTTGENVGTVWFVIDPSGKPVMPPSATASAETATPTSAAMAEEVTLNVANDPKLGAILVDGKGMTLYLFKKDTPGVSNCSGGCLQAWPPFITQGHPTLGPGVDDSKVGTAKLADGRLIVTYGGSPLYYYVKDTKAGETTGQGVGGVWFIVPPSSSSSTSSSGSGY